MAGFSIKSRDYYGQNFGFTRYFLILGGIVFGLYWTRFNSELSLLFMGPSIYLGFWFKQTLCSYVKIEHPEALAPLWFLLPATLIYYAGTGFLIKHLLCERGPIRILTLVAFSAFLIFIHATTWIALTGYFSPPALV